jgi:hypothetical protein
MEGAEEILVQFEKQPDSGPMTGLQTSFSDHSCVLIAGEAGAKGGAHLCLLERGQHKRAVVHHRL